jgi:hypothetical protein
MAQNLHWIVDAEKTNFGIATEYYQNFKSNALYVYGVNSKTLKLNCQSFVLTIIEFKVSTKKSVAKQANKNHKIWRCNYCGKNMESEYILNFHILLEHSKSARSPVGVA